MLKRRRGEGKTLLERAELEPAFGTHQTKQLVKAEGCFLTAKQRASITRSALSSGRPGTMFNPRARQGSSPAKARGVAFREQG